MAKCDTHGKEFVQYFQFNNVVFSPMKEGDTVSVSDKQIEKREFMCPKCRDILFKELGYD